MIFSLIFHIGSVEPDTHKTGENQMNCITMLLKTSDVMAVRRAVFAAGADRAVMFPVPAWARTAHFHDWYSGNSTKCDAPIRIDVVVDDGHIDDVISAFLVTASVGKIGRIKRQNSKSTGAFQRFLHAA